ncbi:MAG: DNA replication and repair protein RecF [candidate division WOR-3 bacterium]
MPLVQLTVSGFRNLLDTRLELSPDINYLFGPNAAGKTNLLEAVYYLAIGRSFRRSPDKELLGFGQSCLTIAGTDRTGQSGEIRYDGREKRILRNGTEIDRLSAYLGWLPVVVFLLDDIDLVRGAPTLRRGFLDLAIAKTDPAYIPVLNKYRHALRQHNRLLEQAAAMNVREAWESELVQTGVAVYKQRLRVVGPLLEAAMRHGRTLLGTDCSYEYRPSIGTIGSENSHSDLTEQFRTRLVAFRHRSEELKQTVVGPHRDDILVRSADRELRRFGSIGEQRLAAVALRLAEADLLASSQKGPAVFLLDEIVSELDEQRSRMVLELVAQRGQMIYAAAKDPRRKGWSGHWIEMKDGLRPGSEAAAPSASEIRELFPAGKVFHVQAGKISEVR